MCGTGSTGNSASVNVIQPQIQAEALSTSTICQGQSIRLSISVVGKLSSNSQLVIQISDPTGNNFVDLPTQVSLFTLSAQIPAGFQTGTGYRIKVAAKNTDYFSSVLGPFNIITPPPPPVVVENYSFCQNSETSPLTATGTNLKWYTGELDVKPFLNITPPTGNTGTFSYYVSQSNSYGCESKKAKINVTIIPLATAIISGDVSMLKGDSTLLDVNLTGELPIELKLSDGRSFVCNKTPFSIEVRPTKSTTYSIKEIKNSCGVGFVNGSARITILEPLADEEAVKEQVKVYPNPTTEQVFVEFVSSASQNSSINIIDVGGKIIQTRNLKGLGKQHEVFDVSNYSAGIYFIKTDFDKRVSIKKIIIEK